MHFHPLFPKTNDDQSSNYAGSVGLLMQIDRKMFVDRLHSVPGGHGPRSRSLDDDAGLPSSFETAYRGTRASLDLLPTLEESSVNNSASLKDEPETVAEVFKTFKKLNDSVNRNIEQLQTATRSLAHHVSRSSCPCSISNLGQCWPNVCCCSTLACQCCHWAKIGMSTK